MKGLSSLFYAQRNSSSESKELVQTHKADTGRISCSTPWSEADPTTFWWPETAWISSFLFPSRRFMTLDIKPALIREKWLASADLGRHSCLSRARFHVNSCLAGHVRGAGLPWPLSSTTGCCPCVLSMHTSGACSAVRLKLRVHKSKANTLRT